MAGGVAVFLAAGTAAFLASGSSALRPDWIGYRGQGHGILHEREPQRAEFSQFEQVQRAAVQTEAETAKRLSFLQVAADRLSPEEYPASVHAALAWPAQEREGFLIAIARRWATTDARAASTFFAALEDPELRVTVTGAAMEIWAGRAADDALSWLRTQPESTLRTELLERLITLTAERDSAHALAAFDLLPAKQRDQDRRRRLALRLAAADPRAAAAAMLKADSLDPSDRNALLKIAERCVQADLSGTLAWLKSLDGRQGSEFRSALLRAWGGVNPRAALEWTKQFDNAWRSPRAADVIAGWAAKDPTSARAYVTALPPGFERELFMGALIYKIGVERKDIATVIALYRERTPAGDGELQKNLPYLIRDGTADHRTVAEAIRALPQDDRNRKLLDGFLASWSEKNPAEAAEYMGTNGLAAENPVATAAVAKAFAGLDPERAIHWAIQLPSGEARENAVTAALQQLAATDATRAWSLCEANLPMARQREVAASVASAWADRDAASAAAWAGRLTDQTARARAFGAIANVWAQNNPQDCAAWLEKLETGPVRDDAIRNFASRTVFQDPKSALAWAASIGDAEQRQRQLRDLADTWHGRNPREAARWISTTDLLSPSTKQWLLSMNYGEYGE